MKIKIILAIFSILLILYLGIFFNGLAYQFTETRGNCSDSGGYEPCIMGGGWPLKIYVFPFYYDNGNLYANRYAEEINYTFWFFIALIAFLGIKYIASKLYGRYKNIVRDLIVRYKNVVWGLVIVASSFILSTWIAGVIVSLE